MGAVIGALGELGYGLAWRVLDAQHFGVPQRRRRVVIVGRLGASGASPARILLEPDGSRGDLAEGVEEGPDATTDAARGAGVPSLSPTLTSPRRGQRYNPDEALIVSALTAASGGPDDNDAQAGHLVVSTFQKVIRSGARDADGSLPPEVWEARDVAATLNLHDLGSGTRAVELVVCATGDVTHTLTADGADASEDGTGRGTPIIAATLTAGVSSPGVSAPGRRNEDDVNLVAFDGTGITPTLAGSRPHAIASDTQVRRLTPLECERLQGFPDGWTAGQADSPRYRQMGNAVAVPVFEWVARRVIAEDSRMRRAA
jgi:DNA (cytosine-5)-methyltransferase 1